MDERAALRQEARRREVLDAALDIFSRRGYRATSMQDIADRLKVGKASLYHYVGSKEEVLIELYEEVLRENVTTARSVAAADASAIEALRRILIERVAYTCRNQQLLRIFFEEEAELPRRQRGQLIAVRHEYEDTVLGLVERAQASGELELRTTPHIFVNTVLGAANWVYKWYDPKGTLSPEALGQEIVGSLLPAGSKAQQASSAAS